MRFVCELADLLRQQGASLPSNCSGLVRPLPVNLAYGESEALRTRSIVCRDDLEYSHWLEVYCSAGPVADRLRVASSQGGLTGLAPQRRPLPATFC
ncbi:hypothetical protein JMJ77_0002468 [Colletotrichum scovillei]|uniref:Uncharacterized protein n=1 Tax=Colletotrichum scovillei TaxID=1209932 RepID=A0A9P7RBD4_9PEZI|nr:hypothetical protein JMJ77_0002468 [Colletotrichum scovillei]KAG7070887.1 hypothetical protein JMJ76_0002130 [Colletotrichum scovillei]KAG7079131.1 hypothetical protein JMJ78_0002791 [Colletotrichum scovillei]